MSDPIKLFTIPAGAKLENLGAGVFRVTHPDGRVEDIRPFAEFDDMVMEAVFGERGKSNAS